MAYIVMAYIVMAYMVMAYIVMACIVVAYVVVVYWRQFLWRQRSRSDPLDRSLDEFSLCRLLLPPRTRTRACDELKHLLGLLLLTAATRVADVVRRRA